MVRRIWPPERRRLHNEITGWQISVLGTTYAVIMGFMMFATWSDFREAESNVATESSCLINLYWAAGGLPQGQRDEVRRLATDYANAMLNTEWPEMARGVLSDVGTEIIEKLWAVASQTQSLTASQQVGLEAVTNEIGSITEHRRIRQLQSQITLPAVLWEVLIVGAIITVMSSCLFGSEYPALHMLQVLTLSLLLAMVLVAISDVNRPFRGFVHVPSTGFENAKHTFDKYNAMPGPK